MQAGQLLKANCLSALGPDLQRFSSASPHGDEVGHVPRVLSRPPHPSLCYIHLLCLSSRQETPVVTPCGDTVHQRQGG
ncbi:hypothetical protein DPEC_G00206450 [Dallia pectoralis]|uniref:Uncharacterized protein n=1 Tax=Dallia pectoralis TaxID=75939 RepID=A0ACC2G4S7_DALPE|nr:hypothetical protein DPEC_G00206450 [Dallia pectoralis]